MHTSEKLVVIPDLHGRADKLGEVINYYDDSVDYLSVGDTIDRGPDSKSTVQMLIDIGATVLDGNHEITLLAALDEHDEVKRHVQQHEIWMRPGKTFRYENRLLESYGVDSRLDPSDAATELRICMEALGHFQFLRNAPLYFENDQFIIVHAGLDDTPWEAQRAALDQVWQNMQAGDYGDEPHQIFDRKWQLATQSSAATATDKIVVSGHAHNLKSPEDNTNPKRVRLASRLEKGLPLFVWQSWDGQIIAF